MSQREAALDEKESRHKVDCTRDIAARSRLPRDLGWLQLDVFGVEIGFGCASEGSCRTR